MPDESDPPRKHYGFKEREFKRDNPLSSEVPPMPTAKELAMLATQGGPAKGSKKLPAPKAAPPATDPAKAHDPNDVHAALHLNRATEKKFGRDEIEIKEIKSRRAREFWLVLVGGNLAIIGAVVMTNINVVSVMFGFGGVIIFSIGLSWIMWQVMDRY